MTSGQYHIRSLEIDGRAWLQTRFSHNLTKRRLFQPLFMLLSTISRCLMSSMVKGLTQGTMNSVRSFDDLR